ncbi:MAG: hypothetical protein V1676_03500 [Candidatus Diapherotrites archaeon]
MDMQKIGSWAFLLGVLIALVAGIATAFMTVDASMTMYAGFAMLVLGLIIGLLNVTDKETVAFLVAAIALISTKAALGALGSPVLEAIVGNIAALAAPAAFVVALKAVWTMSRHG